MTFYVGNDVPRREVHTEEGFHVRITAAIRSVRANLEGQRAKRKRLGEKLFCVDDALLIFISDSLGIWGEPKDSVEPVHRDGLLDMLANSQQDYRRKSLQREAFAVDKAMKVVRSPLAIVGTVPYVAYLSPSPSAPVRIASGSAVLR